MKNVAVTITITTTTTPEAQTVIDALRATVAKSPTGVGFVSIKGYENRYGEVSNNLINVGASYENAKKKDIKFLEALDLTKLDTNIDIVTLEKARTELINSLVSPSKARSEGQKNAYTNICAGLKVHNETGAVYAYGFRVKKDVIQKGEYPSVNSSQKTLAKNFLRKEMKTAKFTQYKVEKIDTMSLNGETLEF